MGTAPRRPPGCAALRPGHDARRRLLKSHHQAAFTFSPLARCAPHRQPRLRILALLYLPPPAQSLAFCKPLSYASPHAAQIPLHPGMPGRPRRGDGRRMVEHLDPAGCVPGRDEVRRIFANLGIAPNILSRRLAHLTESGMFVRRRYHERPPRYEYVLTDKARDFFPVVVTLLAWGNKHLAPKGKSILLANRRRSLARSIRSWSMPPTCSRSRSPMRSSSPVPAPAAGCANG